MRTKGRAGGWVGVGGQWGGGWVGDWAEGGWGGVGGWGWAGGRAVSGGGWGWGAGPFRLDGLLRKRKIGFHRNSACLLLSCISFRNVDRYSLNRHASGNSLSFTASKLDFVDTKNSQLFGDSLWTKKGCKLYPLREVFK